MSHKHRQYVSYLLRVWRADGDEAAVWRASLQDPHTGQRIGFADLQRLFAFLVEQTGDAPRDAHSAPVEERGDAP